MNKFEELVKEYCPNRVEYRTLEKCCLILDNKRKPVTMGAVAGLTPLILCLVYGPPIESF